MDVEESATSERGMPKINSEDLLTNKTKGSSHNDWESTMNKNQIDNQQKQDCKPEAYSRPVLISYQDFMLDHQNAIDIKDHQKASALKQKNHLSSDLSSSLSEDDAGSSVDVLDQDYNGSDKLLASSRKNQVIDTIKNN